MDLIDQNFNLHATRIPDMTEGMRVFRTDHLTWVDSGLSCDTFNIIHIWDGKGVEEQEIKAAVNHFREQNCEFCLWIHERNLNERVKSTLMALGLGPQNEELGMVLDMDDLYLPGPPADEGIKVVDSPLLLKTYAQVLASHWHPPDENVLKYYARTASHYLHAGDIQLFLAYQGEKPVATLELFPTNPDTVGIYGFATLAAYQGLGIGSSLFVFVLHQIRNLGYKQVILQATEAGLGIYQRFGFQPKGKYIEYA